MRGSRRVRCGCGGSLTCGSLGDKIIMELNDAAKKGDVETAWDSSEVGADAEIEYVPLMRVENSSSPSQQPNTATLKQPTIEGISTICWFVVIQARRRPQSQKSDQVNL